MYRIIILTVAILCLGFSLRAQDNVIPSLPDNDAMMHSHFKLDDNKINVSIEVVLPRDERLIVSSYGLRSWEDSNALPQIVDAAANVVARITDSFKNSNTTKIVSIHIPIDNSPVTVNYREVSMGNTFVMDMHTQSPLKIGMDTIRVLKTFSEKKNKDKSISLRQVQYTFLVKDIDDIAKLQDEKELLTNINHVVDSIEGKGSKWLDQNRLFSATYNPLSDKRSERVIINPQDEKYGGLTAGRIGFHGSVGVDLVRATWMPYVDLGLTYDFESKPNKITYLNLYVSAFDNYTEVSNNQYNLYETEFINAGFGTRLLINEPLNNVGVSFGYKVYTNDPSMQGQIIRLSFNVGITPIISVKFSANNNLTHKSQSFIDVGVTANLF